MQLSINFYHVDITGVSPNMGSINGGTTITIFGEYFDSNATEIEVLVGGEVSTIYYHVPMCICLRHTHFHVQFRYCIYLASKLTIIIILNFVNHFSY